MTNDVELWVVAIRQEPDSPHELFPAESKEIAERAVERLRHLTQNGGNQLLIETFDDWCHVATWNGFFDTHKEKMFFTEQWFYEPLCYCQNLEMAISAFEIGAGDFVECNKGNQTLVTRDFEAAKRFFKSE